VDLAGVEVFCFFVDVSSSSSFRFRIFVDASSSTSSRSRIFVDVASSASYMNSRKLEGRYHYWVTAASR
jgi:hypothetical protein